MHQALATIDLSALKHNLSQAVKYSKNSKLFAVVKANAYGHGVVNCLKALSDADGFAVATVEEAIEIRQSGVDKPILVLSRFNSKKDVPLIVHHNLFVVIHSYFQLELLLKASHINHPINCWIKIDTGMNRLGFRPKDFIAVLNKVKAQSTLKLNGIMSHLACADEIDNDFTNKQIECFLQMTKSFNLPLSLANSAAILCHPNSHYHWNRPGLMLYGVNPVATDKSSQFDLKPVMEFASFVIAIKPLKKGQGIGYGLKFIADKQMDIAIVACGYADGYPRLDNVSTPVLIEGHKTKVIGRVSMDTLAIDITNIKKATINSKVQFWGKDVDVNTVAQTANTIAYDLLCRVSKRVERNYINGG